MPWLYLVSYFVGGAFLANAVPLFVSGVMGRPFQSPFAKRPGEGLSSASVNVLWAYINIVVGYVLVFCIGDFESRDTTHIVALGLGSLLASLVLVAAIRPRPRRQGCKRVRCAGH